MAMFCMKHLRRETAEQYQREEQVAVLQRAALAEQKLGELLTAMSGDRIAPDVHRDELREALAQHFRRSAYERCKSMGEIVRENLESIRLGVS